jgi:hypothetical protein
LSFLTDDYGKISFIHPSVHRWFGNGPQHGKLLSEGYLAKTCLTYLNFDVFEEIKTLDIMRSPEKYFFANYAFQFWEDHTRNVEEEVEVQELAFHFLQSMKRRNLIMNMTQGFWSRAGFLFPPFGSGEHEYGLPVLHFVAGLGLTSLCKILLNAGSGRFCSSSYNVLTTSNSERLTLALGSGLAWGPVT